MRIVLIGHPDSTLARQADLLRDHLGVPILSTGELLRREIAAGTVLGEQARRAVAGGAPVPDATAQAVLADRLRRPDTRHGFVLDGFPRTPAQADWLDAMLLGGPGLDAVIHLTSSVDAPAALSAPPPGSASARLEPVLGFYRDLVLAVDGDRPAQLVHQEVVAALHSRVPVG